MYDSAGTIYNPHVRFKLGVPCYPRGPQHVWVAHIRRFDSSAILGGIFWSPL